MSVCVRVCVYMYTHNTRCPIYISPSNNLNSVSLLQSNYSNTGVLAICKSYYRFNRRIECVQIECSSCIIHTMTFVHCTLIYSVIVYTCTLCTVCILYVQCTHYIMYTVHSPTYGYYVYQPPYDQMFVVVSIYVDEIYYIAQYNYIVVYIY